MGNGNSSCPTCATCVDGTSGTCPACPVSGTCPPISYPYTAIPSLLLPCPTLPPPPLPTPCPTFPPSSLPTACPACPTFPPATTAYPATAAATTTAVPNYSLSSMIYSGFYLLGSINPNVMIDHDLMPPFTSSSTTFTFNFKFLLPPVVFLTAIIRGYDTSDNVVVSVKNVTTSSCTILCNNPSGLTDNQVNFYINYIAIGISSDITHINNISSRPIACSVAMRNGMISPIYLPCETTPNIILDIGNVSSSIGATNRTSISSSDFYPLFTTKSYRQVTSNPSISLSPSCTRTMSSGTSSGSMTTTTINTSPFDGKSARTIFMSVESSVRNNANSAINYSTLSFLFTLFDTSAIPTQVRYLALGQTCLPALIPSLDMIQNPANQVVPVSMPPAASSSSGFGAAPVPVSSNQKVQVIGIGAPNMVLDYGIAPIYSSNTGTIYFNFAFASPPPLVLINVIKGENAAIVIKSTSNVSSVSTTGFDFILSGSDVDGAVMYMAIGPISPC